MKIIFKAVAVTAVLLTFITMGLFAQVTSRQTINVQGRLTDSSGANKPDGTYTLVFKLYQNPTDTIVNCKWQERKESVTCTNGIFNVYLGELNNIDTIFNQFDNLWLETTIVTGPGVFAEETLLPRQKIVSVGYAMRAQTADLATNANYAVSATNADHADSATNANHADIASEANHATNSTNANNAITAGTVTNGVYTNGSYTNPAWITSLSGTKITGPVANATTATNATNATNATTAVNATKLNNVEASKYLRNDQAGTINGNLTVNGNISGGGLMKVYSASADNWNTDLTVTIPAGVAPTGMLIFAHIYLSNWLTSMHWESIGQYVYLDSTELGNINQTLALSGSTGGVDLQIEGDYCRPFVLIPAQYTYSSAHVIKMQAVGEIANTNANGTYGLSNPLAPNSKGSFRRTLAVIVY
ncbi:MAG: hypothetical protein A2252_07330 [Elusimicrobia bacterium RIFOXYA2_FULL_39_19]|nr:MAG: hypothetical protein A2252_07330 [Elusimicrobia bacterium RIFOXYA2_FULL_39_19]